MLHNVAIRVPAFPQPDRGNRRVHNQAGQEASRSSIPITLLDLDDLVDLHIEHYENMDTDARALLPLLRFYWPAP
jgi:predicted Mrr-cat superfamily restriction endonuclease